MVALLAVLAIAAPAATQTYTIMPSPFQVALDNSGNIINNGCIWTYVAGTSTAASTFSDSTGTLNTNPIKSDSAGRFTAYLSPGQSYKFVYEAPPCATMANPTLHGTVLRTADPIAAVPVSGLNVDITGTAGEALSAGELVYLSDGSGSLQAGQWYKADADTTYASTTSVRIGIAVAAISSGSSGSVRTAGRVTGLTGLTTGETYYASATAGALTATPPTNAVCIGKADSTTSLVMPCDVTVTRLPDSDGTHSLVVTTTSNLTADRLFTLVPGDAARTLTMTGDASLNQSVLTTSAPTFNYTLPCQGRLTGTTGVPITTSDVNGTTSVYYTPFEGNQCWVYDGSAAWVLRTFTEFTVSLAGCTASRPYDLFLYDNAGTLATETLIWTNGTTRGTALTKQNGVWVKTGATTRRFVGSYYCNSSGGQTDDSYVKRFICNAAFQRGRPLRKIDASVGAYASATIRQLDNDPANKVEVLACLPGIQVTLETVTAMSNGTANAEIKVGIGEDATTSFSSSLVGGVAFRTAVSGDYGHLVSRLDTMPTEGYHYYSINESVSTGQINYTGNNGMTGFIVQ